MERVILVRHAESELSVQGACNGDPSLEGGGLSETGREQARALGTLLADDQISLCATSEFRRARETADIVLEGRDVPRVVLPDLNDIRFGHFEGALLEEYRRWARTAGPADDCPGGGESRADAAARYARAFRLLLARPDPTVLVVGHALPIRYALSALTERDPAAVIESVQYAEPQRMTAEQLERVAERLERWAAAPVFA